MPSRVTAGRSRNAASRHPARARSLIADDASRTSSRRAQDHLRVVAVDDHRRRRLDTRQDLLDPADHRHVECPRDNRDMRRRRTFLQHHCSNLGAVVVEQLRRPHGAREQHGIFGKIGARGRPVAGQMTQQPVGEVFEVGEALAQIGVGDLRHAHARVVLHALHRASAVRPERIASPMRPSQPRSSANMR